MMVEDCSIWVALAILIICVLVIIWAICCDTVWKDEPSQWR